MTKNYKTVSLKTTIEFENLVEIVGINNTYLYIYIEENNDQ